MKLSYFKYYFEHEAKRYQVSLVNFLKIYTGLDTKRKLMIYQKLAWNIEEDFPYLFHISGNVFLFIVTKDHEIIKTIQTDNINQADIKDKLDLNETIGFASYVYIGDNYLGIASTFLGPKSGHLMNFINSLLKSVGIPLVFDCLPLTKKSTKHEVEKLDFLSTVSMELAPEHAFCQILKTFFNASLSDVQHINISFSPTTRKPMNDTAHSILNNLDIDSNTTKFFIKAKEMANESLKEYVLIGVGQIFDNVQKGSDATVAQKIETIIRQNSVLSLMIEEFTDEKETLYKTDYDISNFSNLNYWCNLFPVPAVPES